MHDTPANQKTALLVVGMSSFTMPMMLSSVNVAIPSIALSLHAEVLLLSWLSTGYLLSSAVFLLPAGKLADIYGRKRVFLCGMLIITLASLMAAFSQSIVELLCWRVLQGLGSAMLFATGVAILSSVFPPQKRGGAIGITVSAVYFGLACGPLLGGWLTQHFSWRSVFVVHLPVALLVMLITVFKLQGEWRAEHRQKIDFTGALLYAIVISSIMIGLSRLPSSSGTVLLATGVLTLFAFVRYENRIASPILELAVFRHNRLLSYSCMASFILYSATFALTFLMSLYLQNIRGMSAQFSGLILILQPLVMAAFSPRIGKLSDHYEPRYLTASGMCLVSLGLGLLAALDFDSSLLYILFSLALIGLGFALFSSPNVNAIMGSVEKQYLGVISGTLSTTRVLGQMFSMAIVTVAFALLMGERSLASEHSPQLLQSIHFSFVAACALACVGIYLSFSRGNAH